MLLGIAAFALPLAATEVAYAGTTLTVGAAGILGLLNIFCAQTGQHKLKSGVSGALYLALAYFMANNPAAGLDIITVSVAGVLALEGIYETALAIRNETIEGRGPHFVSGVGSVAVATWLGAMLLVSSLFLPGAALGARLTSNGATKVQVGLAGKKIAYEQKKK